MSKPVSLPFSLNSKGTNAVSVATTSSLPCCAKACPAGKAKAKAKPAIRVFIFLLNIRYSSVGTDQKPASSMFYPSQRRLMTCPSVDLSYPKQHNCLYLIVLKKEKPREIPRFFIQRVLSKLKFRMQER